LGSDLWGGRDLEELRGATLSGMKAVGASLAVFTAASLATKEDPLATIGERLWSDGCEQHGASFRTEQEALLWIPSPAITALAVAPMAPELAKPTQHPVEAKRPGAEQLRPIELSQEALEEQISWPLR